METTENKFSIDDYVGFSLEGLKQIKPFKPDKRGTVVRFDRDGYPVIHWDSCKKPDHSAYHPDYLEKLHKPEENSCGVPDMVPTFYYRNPH